MALDIKDYNPPGYPLASMITPHTMAVINTDLPYSPHLKEGTVVKVRRWAGGSRSVVVVPSRADGVEYEVHNKHLNHDEL